MQQLLFGRYKFQARKSDAIPTLSSHVGFTFSKDRSLEVFRLTRERPLALRLKTNLNSCSVTTCNFREHSLHVYKRTNHPKYFLITFFLFAAPLISRNYPWYIMLRWIARWREEDENFSTSFIFGIIFFLFLRHHWNDTNVHYLEFRNDLHIRSSGGSNFVRVRGLVTLMIDETWTASRLHEGLNWVFRSFNLCINMLCSVIYFGAAPGSVIVGIGAIASVFRFRNFVVHICSR